MSSISRLTGAAIAVAAIVALTPSIGRAQEQGQIIITPFAAVYAPTTDLTSMSATQAGTSASVSLKQKTGFAVGANASYWFTDRTALELGTAYAWSDAKANASIFGGGTGSAFSSSEKAYVLMGSLKAMYNLVPQPANWNLRLGVGPAMIHHAGKAWDTNDNTEINGRTNWGGVLSLCSRFAITPNVGLRIRAENYMYRTALKFHDPADPASDFSFDKKFQNDMLLSAGLQFTMPR